MIKKRTQKIVIDAKIIAVASSVWTVSIHTIVYTILKSQSGVSEIAGYAKAYKIASNIITINSHINLLEKERWDTAK